MHNYQSYAQKEIYILFSKIYYIQYILYIPYLLVKVFLCNFPSPSLFHLFLTQSTKHSMTQIALFLAQNFPVIKSKITYEDRTTCSQLLPSYFLYAYHDYIEYS